MRAGLVFQLVPPLRFQVRLAESDKLVDRTGAHYAVINVDVGMETGFKEVPVEAIGRPHVTIHHLLYFLLLYEKLSILLNRIHFILHYVINNIRSCSPLTSSSLSLRRRSWAWSRAR